MRKEQREVLEIFNNGTYALVDRHTQTGRYAVMKHYNPVTEVGTTTSYFETLGDARKDFAVKTIGVDSATKSICIGLGIHPEKDVALYRSIHEMVEYSDFTSLFHPELIRKCELEQVKNQIQQKEKVCIKTEEDLIQLIEQEGWNVDVSDYDYEIQQESPAGEDFYFCIPRERSLQATLRSIQEYCDWFNPEEHASTMQDARNAPTLDILMEDAKDIEVMLKELSYALEHCEVKNKVMEDRTI